MKFVDTDSGMEVGRAGSVLLLLNSADLNRLLSIFNSGEMCTKGVKMVPCFTVSLKEV